MISGCCQILINNVLVFIHTDETEDTALVKLAHSGLYCLFLFFHVSPQKSLYFRIDAAQIFLLGKQLQDGPF